MKTLAVLCTLAFFVNVGFAQGQQDSVDKQLQHIVNNMSLAEKIGQKLMLDFRYWCPVDKPDCKNGVTP